MCFKGECYEAQHSLGKAFKKLDEEDFKGISKEKYFHLKSAYKKLLKDKQKAYQKATVGQLAPARNSAAFLEISIAKRYRNLKANVIDKKTWEAYLHAISRYIIYLNPASVTSRHHYYTSIIASEIL